MRSEDVSVRLMPSCEGKPTQKCGKLGAFCQPAGPSLLELKVCLKEMPRTRRRGKGDARMVPKAS